MKGDDKPPRKGNGGAGGAPSKIDPKKLKAFMRVYPTLEDCAAFFDCTTSAIEKYVKREFGISYSVFRDQNLAVTRFALKRKCIDKALAGDNTMLIWTTKNMCGWKDRDDKKEDQTEGKPFKLAYEVKPKGKDK